MDNLQNTRERDRVNELLREHYALELLELRERVSDLESERDSYRELAQEAVHALHAVTEQRDRALRLVNTLRVPQRVEYAKRSTRRQVAA